MKIEASALVKMFGKDLIGARVFVVEPAGEVPAGWATIKQIRPDKAAPEIVLDVIQDNFGSIGVFENELLDVPIKKGRGKGQFQLQFAVPKKPGKRSRKSK